MARDAILIKPSWSYPISRGESTYNRVWPPLSLMIAASLLRQEKLSVTLLDASAERLSHEETAQRARGHKRAFVTSATLDRWQCPNLNIEPFVTCVRGLRKVVDEVYVLGTHGTVKPAEVLALTAASGVIRGEPEYTILDLCKGVPRAFVEGLTFQDNGQAQHNPDRPPADLNQLPIPSYDLVDVSRYRYEVLGDRFMLFEGSRGCPYQCIFCVKSMYGDRYRKKSAERLIREIDKAVHLAKIRSAYFIDLEFTLNRELVVAVCEHLLRRQRQIEWCCQTRADSVDPQLLSLMKRAGCHIVHFGVETGVQRIADMLGKKLSLEAIERGIQMTHQAGLRSACFFLFGLPTETEADIRQTIRLAQRLNPTYASFHIAFPFPGTPFYNQVRDSLPAELFPLCYSGVVSQQRLQALVAEAFRKYYLRPAYIFSRLRSGNPAHLVRQARFFISYLKHRLA